jgi:hypothetical protein
MIIVLRADATDEQRDAVVSELEGLGLGVRAMRGGGKHLIHLVSGPTRRARRVLGSHAVEALVPTSGPRLRSVGHRIYPYHFIRWCAAGIVIFGLAVLLAGQLPPGTGREIQLDHPPDALAWPWYLHAPRALVLSFAPEQRWMGWGLLLLLLIVTFLLPVLDRTRGEGLRHRWPFVGAGLAALAVAVYLSLAEVAA